MWSNGETTVEVEVLTTDDKIDALLEAVAQLTDKIEALTEQQEEIVEKLTNLTASGSGYEVDEFGDS